MEKTAFVIATAWGIGLFIVFGLVVYRDWKSRSAMKRHQVEAKRHG